MRHLMPALLIIFATPSSAMDEPVAHCATTLTSNQSIIFKSAIATIRPEIDLKSSDTLKAYMRPKVITLVSAGKIKMASAPDDAKAAADCLMLLKPAQ